MKAVLAALSSAIAKSNKKYPSEFVDLESLEVSHADLETGGSISK